MMTVGDLYVFDIIKSYSCYNEVGQGLIPCDCKENSVCFQIKRDRAVTPLPIRILNNPGVLEFPNASCKVRTLGI